MEKIVAEFVQEKETKNTVRYEEETEDGHPPKVRTIYFQKWALGNPYPERIRITAEAVE